MTIHPLPWSALRSASLDDGLLAWKAVRVVVAVPSADLRGNAGEGLVRFDR